jgi:hypothetical protein
MKNIWNLPSFKEEVTPAEVTREKAMDQENNLLLEEIDQMDKAGIIKPNVIINETSDKKVEMVDVYELKRTEFYPEVIQVNVVQTGGESPNEKKKTNEENE